MVSDYKKTLDTKKEVKILELEQKVQERPPSPKRLPVI